MINLHFPRMIYAKVFWLMEILVNWVLPKSSYFSLDPNVLKSVPSIITSSLAKLLKHLKCRIRILQTSVLCSIILSRYNKFNESNKYIFKESWRMRRPGILQAVHGVTKSQTQPGDWTTTTTTTTATTLYSCFVTHSLFIIS